MKSWALDRSERSFEQRTGVGGASESVSPVTSRRFGALQGEIQKQVDQARGMLTTFTENFRARSVASELCGRSPVSEFVRCRFVGVERFPSNIEQQHRPFLRNIYD